MQVLKKFPDSKSPLRVQCRVVSRDRFQVRFFPGTLILPRTRVFGLGWQRDELWRSLCFEVFFRPKGYEGYFECNISATGAWSLYEFTSYRQPQPPRPTKSFQLESFYRGREFIQFVIRGPFQDPGEWQMGYSAVVPREDGALDFFALHHAGAKPDFHHPESFVDQIRF